MSALMTAPTAPVLPSLPASRWKNVAELLHDLGDIPADRVRFSPYPGTATEADVVKATQSGFACELVNGTLVEKPMGNPESFLAGAIITYLNMFIFPRWSGMATVTDGMYRMIHGNIREPDVSFTRRERLPNPLPQVGGWCPDLCVEVLSPGNTKAEMAMKRAEYFSSDCRLVWEIDPETRSADVYTDSTTATTFDETGVLDGQDVLPGFTLPLRELFARFDELSPSA